MLCRNFRKNWRCPDFILVSYTHLTSVSKATLDECPMAYKGMQAILDNIGPTADVVKVIRPIYNFKAGDEA